MTRVLKWLDRGALGLLVFGVLAAGGGYLWFRTSLPEVDGDLTLSGLAGPVEVVRETRHGPVLEDGWEPAREAVGSGHVLALAWTALREDDLTAQAGLALPGAKDWERLVDAFRDFHSPQQNVAYADVDGNIGLLAPARLPIRAGGGPAATSPFPPGVSPSRQVHSAACG